MVALGRSRSRRGGEPRRSPRRPRRLQPDNPVVAVTEPRRKRRLLRPALGHRAGLGLLARRDPLAPSVHRPAQGLGDLHPVADIGGIEQPGLDQRMEVVVIEPDGNQLLRLLDRNDAAAERLGERQRVTAARGAPIEG